MSVAGVPLVGDVEERVVLGHRRTDHRERRPGGEIGVVAAEAFQVLF